ncbi:hypothetical protein BH18ACT17_BH18ACT17_03230 [soil metagenome]
MPVAVDCLIESGNKRTFACASRWPGWCRAGRTEDAALEALLAYGVRYAEVLRGSGPRFAPPTRVEALRVIERAPGNATTDFGAPDGVFEIDASPVAARSWARDRSVLEACWRSFDAAVSEARGREIRRGPRGGGRLLDAIVGHVVGAEASYLRAVTGAAPPVDEGDPWSARRVERTAVLDGSTVRRRVTCNGLAREVA